MTLVADIVALLEENGSPHAMIGATALAVLGSSRSTQDLDILTTDRLVLKQSFWAQLESSPHISPGVYCGRRIAASRRACRKSCSST
jgi:hypothetical protein